MKDAHRLNADYFTIHGASRRDRSPDSSAGGASGKRSSRFGNDGTDESDEDLTDIPNVIALLAVLKKASVDREKIVAVRTFLAQGGEELHYLADNMDEILGLLIYQTSRQRFIVNLHESLSQAKEIRDSDREKEDLDRETVRRKIDNLSRAIDASRAYLKEFDYWKDASESNIRGESALAVKPPFGEDDSNWPEETRAHIESDNADNEIRGISTDAEVDVAPSLLRTAQGQTEGPGDGSLDKGKGKKVE